MFSKIFSRGMPVIVASTFLHVGVAAALVVNSGGSGHKAALVTTLEVNVDVIDLPPAPLTEAPKIEEEEEEDHPAAHAAAPAHTHPYDVPPSHDAHPHDPSIDHHDAVAAAAPAPAEAAPVIAAAAVDSAPMPRFTIAIGNAKTPAPTASNVATNAIGAGGTNVSNTGTTAGHEHDDVAGQVIPESAVSKRATLLASVAAAYPAEARQGELEADVPVEIVVDASGVVKEARIVQKAGSGFDESALAAIKRYRFTPAQRDGRAVSVRMRWSVQFRLR